MILYIFAGPVISNRDYYSLLAVIFVIFGIFLAAVIYLVKKLLNRNKTSLTNTSIPKSFLIAIGILVIVVLVFLIIPTTVKDYLWDRKQSECADKAGYSSPSDNESSKATAASQKSYNECLNTI
jgi:H+/Cl- antiporter ClcA